LVAGVISRFVPLIVLIRRCAVGVGHEPFSVSRVATDPAVINRHLFGQIGVQRLPCRDGSMDRRNPARDIVSSLRLNRPPGVGRPFVHDPSYRSNPEQRRTRAEVLQCGDANRGHEATRSTVLIDTTALETTSGRLRESRTDSFRTRRTRFRVRRGGRAGVPLARGVRYERICDGEGPSTARLREARYVGTEFVRPNVLGANDGSRR
jgi:hypothetical protein